MSGGMCSHFASQWVQHLPWLKHMCGYLKVMITPSHRFSFLAGKIIVLVRTNPTCLAYDMFDRCTRTFIYLAVSLYDPLCWIFITLKQPFYSLICWYFNNIKIFTDMSENRKQQCSQENTLPICSSARLPQGLYSFVHDDMITLLHVRLCNNHKWS